jgi:hypothetical protein
MSYDEEQHKRSRVVVETPSARREVVQQQTVRYPAPERRGYSTGVVATVALLAIAVTAIVFLFLTNSGDESTEANINIRTAAVQQPTPFAQAPVVVQTPLMQPTPPPVIIQQMPATTAPAPIIVQAPPAATNTTTAAPPATAPTGATAANDDSTLQQKVDTAFADDASVAASNVNATVVNGRVRLSGTASSDAVKQRAERLAYAVKGVLGVDNKIVVSPGTP